MNSQKNINEKYLSGKSSDMIEALKKYSRPNPKSNEEYFTILGQLVSHMCYMELKIKTLRKDLDCANFNNPDNSEF